MDDERVYIFANGSQYEDWSSCNCDRCKKSVRVTDPHGETWKSSCEIEDALLEAYCDDGTVPASIAERAGDSPGNVKYVWPCGEVEWTDEWKAEFTRRKKAKGE